jgi:hypothetical protein
MDSIVSYADALPTGGLTVTALRALDWVAPGQWVNTVGFDNMVSAFTGETDLALLGQVRERAIALWNDPSQGYQRGLWIYQAVDSTDKKLGMAAMANKIGDRFSWLGFLSKITPQADTTQTIDLTVKLAAELAAFCYINGLPGDSIGDFVAALGAYEREAKIRMAALVAFDGMLPLGPEFIGKVRELLGRISPADLESNQTFAALRGMIPGGDTASQLGFIGQNFGAVSGWIGGLISGTGMTVERIVGGLSSHIEHADGKLDYLAAYLDMATNYFEHTGTQSLCRSLIDRAVSEI